MNGDALVERVRRILKDVADDTHQGEFWDLREIMLALNVAQDILLNYCLRNQREDLIKGLVKNTGIIASDTTIPTDYVHYVSAQVGDAESTLRTARIYIGGYVDQYINVTHDAAFIFDETLSFRSEGSTSQGQLWYFKRPSVISSTTPPFNTDLTGNDFHDYIYNDIIAVHASILLAIKEIQTQRDIKKNVRVFQEFVLTPPIAARYERPYHVPTDLLARIIAYAEAQRRG